MQEDPRISGSLRGVPYVTGKNILFLCQKHPPRPHSIVNIYNLGLKPFALPLPLLKKKICESLETNNKE